MRIKLIRPFFSKDIYKLFGHLPVKREIRNPLGLMILAGILKKKHDVGIIDGELDGLSIWEIAIKCINSDVVGITCTTPEFKIVDKLVTAIKLYNPSCKVILGGPHPTIVPRECLEANEDIDYIVRYEGERTLPELLGNLKHPKGVKGIAYRDGDNIIVTEDRPLLDDLDQYDADWESVNPTHYLYPFPKEGLVPTANIAGSRGCVFHCRFCTRLFGNKVRFRTPENIADEMKIIKTAYNINHFFFYDECFGLNKEWLVRFMILIAPLDIKFFCMTRANLITENTICRMKRAGLVKVSLGVESGSQEILDREKKGTTLSQYKKAYNILVEYGIETRGSFIFGHPGETHKTARETIEFAKSLKLYRAGFNVMTPYPGIDLLNDEGIEVLSKDYSHYCRWGDSVVRTKELSPEDLKNYQRTATKEFYLSPKVLWYHLKQFLSGEHSWYYYRPLWFALKELFKRRTQ